MGRRLLVASGKSLATHRLALASRQENWQGKPLDAEFAVGAESLGLGRYPSLHPLHAMLGTFGLIQN